MLHTHTLGKKYIICNWCKVLIKVQQPLTKVTSRTYWNIWSSIVAKFTFRKNLRKPFPWFNKNIFLIKVNKSVYIASQYSSIPVCNNISMENVIEFVKSVKSLKMLIRSSNVVKCTLIYFNKTLLPTVYENDWLKLTFNCFFAIQSENISSN